MISTQREEVNALLKRFGGQYGLDACALDQQGSALLAFDDLFVDVLLDEERGELLILATVGRPAPSAEIYGWLLDGNLFGLGARGMALARDPAGHSIILRRALPITSLELDQFEAALQEFLLAAESVRRRLALSEAAGTGDRAEAHLAPQLMQNLLRA
jgi:hypothetical protein